MLPLALVTGLSLQSLILLIVIGQGFALRRLNNKPVPSLVQLSDGKALRVKPTPAQQRTPETIKVFIATTFTTLFNWRGEITNVAGETIRDPGIDMAITSGGDQDAGDETSKQKVTTATATASFALSSDFRASFLTKVAELTPPGVFTGRQQVVMVIDQVGQPIELSTGRWQVDVLAHLNVFDEANTPQQVIQFNRQVVVEATTAPFVPEGESPLEQAIYNIRQAGLQITDIRPIAR